MIDMTITKRGTSPEEKKREGAFVKRYFLAVKQNEPDLSQESLAGEIGVTQGLVGQWFSGATNVPDKALMLLGKRLGFDPYDVRPDMVKYKQPKPTKPKASSVQDKAITPAQKELFDVLQSILAQQPQEVERLTRVLRAFYDLKA